MAGEYYRYVNVRGHYERVELRRFEVVRETEKTVVLADNWTLSGERRVLKGDGHRYAHSTQEAALDDFIARKRRQAAILRGQTVRVAEARAIGEAMKNMTLLPTSLGLDEVDVQACRRADMSLPSVLPPAHP